MIELTKYFRNIDTSSIIYKNEPLDENQNFILQSYGISETFFAVSMPTDGNCFYYSIAKLVTGEASLKLVKCIRLGALFMLFEYEPFFKSLLIESFSDVHFRKLVLSLCDLKSYACLYVQVATSFFLNRQIFNYMCNFKKVESDNNLYEIANNSYKICLYINQSQKSALPLILNQNHFVPLLPISSSLSHTIPIPNETYFKGHSLSYFINY